MDLFYLFIFFKDLEMKQTFRDAIITEVLLSMSRIKYQNIFGAHLLR